MSLPSVDAGVFIAYILPGLIVLAGLRLVVPAVQTLLAADETKNLGGAVFVAVLAMFLGMATSMVRGVAIDPTFRLPLPLLRDRVAAPVEPDYAQLINADKREAFRLAISNEQRPFQFAGNTAVAIAVAAGCWIASLAKGKRRRALLIIPMTIAVVVGLYCGARISYGRYARAVAAINAAPQR